MKNEVQPVKLRIVGAARRRGISELVGSLLAIAMTLIAGAAVFGYVNSQAGVSEVAYGNSVGANVGYLNENFKVIDMYFPSTTEVSFWLYNVGGGPLLLSSVRLYGTAGLVNLMFNFTQSGGSSTNYAYDLLGSSSGCKLTAASFESPALSGVDVKVQNGVLITLTIPGTASGCPSYGQTFNTGTTYDITVVGLYGYSVTYYQEK